MEETNGGNSMRRSKNNLGLESQLIISTLETIGWDVRTKIIPCFIELVQKEYMPLHSFLSRIVYYWIIQNKNNDDNYVVT